jgi:thiamine-monophosphate kinase
LTERIELNRGRHLNEEGVISMIWKTLSPKGVRKGLLSRDPFDDDVAWVSNSSKKKFLVMKSDMFVSSTDAPKQMTPRQMASKAISSAVSDFAAKGVIPKFATISIAIPRHSSSEKFVKSLAAGLRESSRKYKLRILAGDTSGSENAIVIDCTLVGFSDRVVTRRNAKPGDLIGVSGAFGLQSAGLKILIERLESSRLFAKRALETVLNPNAKLDFGLSISEYLTSCIDSSDGLALSLYHLAESSKVNMLLEKIPIAKGVAEFANSNSLNPNDLALFGGEEYELVFTFRAKDLETLSRKGVQVIGKVLSSSSPRRKPQILYRRRIIPRKGWIHNN